MSKRRKIQGQEKEILYFLVVNLPTMVDNDPELHNIVREKLSERGVSLLEFDTAARTIGVIVENEKKVSLEDIYKILDDLGLESHYSRSEFV
jgi:hypothetical protein